MKDYEPLYRREYKHKSKIIFLKTKSIIFSLIELILNFKWRTIIFLLIFPILILLAFFILLEMRQNNLFFMAIFLLNYYVSLFILIILFSKVMSANKARSPFFFIKEYNTTGDKSHWDEFQQQKLRHLIGAEIGVDLGDNAESILNLLNIKQLVLVDPWKQYIDYQTGSLVMGRDQTFYDDLYSKVKSRFSNNSKVKIIRDKSINAAKMFDDKYFDFIYIDGDHSYEGVLADLLAWYPKLKKFGVMCGDDYGHICGHGVIKAVTEFAFKHKILVSHGKDKQFWFVKT